MGAFQSRLILVESDSQFSKRHTSRANLHGGEMFNRSHKSDMTGADVILAMAATASDQGRPYADGFSLMIQEMLMRRPGGPMFGHEAVAASELEEHEEAAAQVVAVAAHYAYENKDWVMLREVATFGANALARWPRFLASTADGHPTFDPKPVPFDFDE